MHSEDPEAGQERWTALVRALHDGADALVAEFMERIQLVPPYAQGLVPAHQVEADAVVSFDYLLRRIGDIPVPSRLHETGPSIGRDRARRGVPLDHLLTAVRLDFRVLWHALRDRCDPEDMGLLVARAEQVWAVVEDYTTTIQVSYLEESALMARERRRERSVLVGSLLAAAQPDQHQVSRVALALDVEPGGVFLVAAAPLHDDKALRAAADQMSAGGRTVHLQETSRHAVLIARWHGDAHGPVTAVLQGARCGVAPTVDGLDRVPHAARVAREIADALPSGATGPHQLRDAWTWLAGTRLGDLAGELAAPVLGGLRVAPEGERKRLVQTARSYAAHGSVQQTAASLYCHRNTVVNRLRRFHELTGCDLTVPRESALAVLALEWARVSTVER